MYKLFLFLGLFFLLLAGMTYFFQGATIGKLPGDIVIQKENYTIYIPVTTMIIVSIALSALLNIFEW